MLDIQQFVLTLQNEKQHNLFLSTPFVTHVNSAFDLVHYFFTVFCKVSANCCYSNRVKGICSLPSTSLVPRPYLSVFQCCTLKTRESNVEKIGEPGDEANPPQGCSVAYYNVIINENTCFSRFESSLICPPSLVLTLISD